MAEDAEVLEMLDDLLSKSQEVQGIIDWYNDAYQHLRYLGAPVMDLIMAVNGLTTAASNLESIALAIKAIAEHEERILA